MIIKKWLTVNKQGSTRLTASAPALEVDEITMQLEVSIPDALFRKPRLQASITIPESAATPEVFSTEVVDNVQELIRQATGLEMVVKVVEHAPDPS